MQLIDELRSLIPITVVPTGTIMDAGNSIGVLWYRSNNIVSTALIETEFKISIEECLDQNPTFKNFTLLHEYVHTLDIQTSGSGQLIRDTDISTFFDCNIPESEYITVEIFNRLPPLMDELLGLIEIKSSRSWFFSHGNIVDSEELIANFGAMMYMWPEQTKEALPEASIRFIELLRNSHYGEDAKKIFRHLIKE